MSDEKFCPFMSRPIIIDSVTNDVFNQNNWVLFETACIKDRCIAWAKINRRFDGDGNIIEATCGCRLIP